MKQNTKIKTFIFAAAVSLGLASSAFAQSANVAVPNPAETDGSALLGSRYTAVTYNYTDLTGAGPNHADGFGLTFNQPLKSGFDLTANYDWARAKYAGTRLTQQDFSLGGTAFTNLTWGKPFVLADAGWAWAKGGGASDNSFFYRVGVGVELPVSPAFSVTPYVNFVRATGFNQSEGDFGVKAAYRVTKDWSVIAKVQYDAVRHEKDSTEYTIGAAYHF